MEILNAEGTILEIRDYSINNIPNILEPLLNRKNNSRGYSIEELLNEMAEVTNRNDKKEKSNYILWIENSNIVGYAFLDCSDVSEASICFKILKDGSISHEFVQAYLESSVGYWFKKYSLIKVLFDASNNSPNYLGKLFLKIFHPYPIGWIHLEDNKYVLTKQKLNHTEENFYKL